MDRRRPLVWDLPVRLFHVGLIAAVGTAWWTAGSDRLLHVHTLAGHALVPLLAFRLLWAFVGTRHARWRGLAWPARAVAAHARGLLRGDAPRHVGHNPIAGWAAMALFALLVGIAITGALTLFGAERQGLFAGAVSMDAGMAAKAVHEALAWGVLAWIGVHLAGVVKESLRTRENLPLGMVHGHKAATADQGVRPHRGVALALVSLGALGGGLYFQGWWVSTDERPWLPFPPVAMADDPVWRDACGECHLAFHPALLPARSWARTMAEQGDHFDEDLGLDAETADRIRAFLVSNAAEASATEWAWEIARAVPAGEAPLRVTGLPWWEAKHEAVPEDVWDRPEVGGDLQCEACHLDAERGSFEDGAMRIPEPVIPPLTQR